MQGTVTVCAALLRGVSMCACVMHVYYVYLLRWWFYLGDLNLARFYFLFLGVLSVPWLSAGKIYESTLSSLQHVKMLHVLMPLPHCKPPWPRYDFTVTFL